MGNTKVKRSRCPIKALFVAKHTVKSWYILYIWYQIQAWADLQIKGEPRRLGTGAITISPRINVSGAHLHDPTV